MTKLGAWLLLAVAGCATAPEPSPVQPEAPWGEEVRGWRCRVRVPASAMRGDLVRTIVDVRLAADGRTPVDEEVPGPRDDQSNLSLELVGASGRTVVVHPYDPNSGMRPDPVLRPRDVVVKDDTLTLPIEFPLAAAWDDLPPGEYRCRFRMWFDARTDRHFTRNLSSAEFPLRIEPAPPREEAFLLPKALRIVETTFTTRDEGVETTIPVRQVIYAKADAEEIRLPRRNGFFLGTSFERDGQGYALLGGATIEPDGANPIDASYGTGPDAQKLGASYTIVLFETADAPEHMWHPGPGSGGYRELWRRTIQVTPATSPR